MGGDRRVKLRKGERKTIRETEMGSVLGYRPPAPETLVPGYGSTSRTLTVVQ
jgi:hypothetical protein